LVGEGSGADGATTKKHKGATNASTPTRGTLVVRDALVPTGCRDQKPTTDQNREELEPIRGRHLRIG
jgi:hypothetical protein